MKKPVKFIILSAVLAALVLTVFTFWYHDTESRLKTTRIRHPRTVEYGGVEMIPFPRSVMVGRFWIDNNLGTIAYEEKEIGNWAGSDGYEKAVFITTDVIKRYYDRNMKCKDGVYTFQIGSLDVTLTKDSISATNELFGEIYREDDINCIVRKRDMLVEEHYISRLLGLNTVGSGYPPGDMDGGQAWVKDEVLLEPWSLGEVNIGMLYRNGYEYHIGKKIKKPENYERLMVNMRGNYICKTDDGSYVLEAGRVFYELNEEIVPGIY